MEPYEVKKKLDRPQRSKRKAPDELRKTSGLSRVSQ